MGMLLEDKQASTQGSEQQHQEEQGKTGAMIAYLEIAEGGLRASITPRLLDNSNAEIADALTST